MTAVENVGIPETYGLRGDGHCGHCGGRPEHQATSEHGTFCCACFRWCVYVGPPRPWGDGMAVTGERRPQCSATCHWYDLGYETRCLRPEGHRGDHRDGLRWFDDHGMQTPRERNLYPFIGRGAVAGSRRAS